MTPFPFPLQQKWVFKIIIYTFLRKRNSVVLQEDDFQLASNQGIVIHHVSHRGDELDDHFRHVVSWRGLRRTTTRIVHFRSRCSVPAPSRSARAAWHAPRPTFPPTITVRGTKGALGFFLMPDGNKRWTFRKFKMNEAESMECSILKLR